MCEASSMQTWTNFQSTFRLRHSSRRSMAGLVEAAEVLDIDVDQLAGPFPFIATWWFGGLQGAQLVEAQALEHTAHSGG